MTQIISVSIDNKQKEWLDTQKGRKDCSPTFLLRRAIHEKMQEMGDEYFEDIKDMRKKVAFMADRFQKTINFVNEKGLTDEFLEKL
jgi:hypothetical protein